MIELLRCPRTGQRLTVAPVELVQRLTARRDTLRNGDGEMPETFDGGYVTEDGKQFYPRREGVPVLLPNAGIAVE